MEAVSVEAAVDKVANMVALAARVTAKGGSVGGRDG